MAFLSGGLREKGIFGSRAWRAWRAFNIWQYFFKIWFLGNFIAVLHKMEEWQQQAQMFEDVSLQRKEIEAVRLMLKSGYVFHKLTLRMLIETVVKDPDVAKVV